MIYVFCVNEKVKHLEPVDFSSVNLTRQCADTTGWNNYGRDCFRRSKTQSTLTDHVTVSKRSERMRDTGPNRPGNAIKPNCGLVFLVEKIINLDPQGRALPDFV